MDYYGNGHWDVARMLEDGRTMTVGEARALGNKSIIPNTSKTNEFVAVTESGMVIGASWTYNRVIRNGGIRYTIIHRPTQRVVRRD